MKTSLRFSYFLRLSGITLIGIFITKMVPLFSAQKIPAMANPLYGLILFVFLSGFLVNQVMSRNKALRVSISLELSRTRRIMHLIENMGVGAAWKRDVKKCVIAYLKSIASHNFSLYQKSDEAFRLMTHKIYACAPKTRRDELLFSELLLITRELAFERQEISHSLTSPITSYVWIVFFLVGMIDIILLLLVRDASLLATWYVFFGTILILLILDLLVELSILKKTEKKEIQLMYAENCERIKQE